MTPTYVSGTGSYNGYAVATVAGIPNQDLICDDYADTTYMPSGPLIYDYSTLNAGNNYLEYVRFTGTGGKTTLELYEEAAVLLANFQKYMSTGTPNPQTITDYNYALWNLFDPTGPDPAPETTGSVNPSSPGSIALQNAAWETVTGTSPEQIAATAAASRVLLIYTPTFANPTDQEFLALDPPAPTPEPGTAPLLTALLLAAIAWNRRHTRLRLPRGNVQ